RRRLTKLRRTNPPLKEPIAMKLAGPTIAVLAGLTIAATALAADPTPVGRPKGFGPGKGTGYALWYKDGEWHLRVTWKKWTKQHFEGTVTVVDGKFTDGSFDKLEAASRHGMTDRAVVDGSGSKLEFIFGNAGGLDGVDFKVSDSATAISCAFLMNGNPS